MRSSITIEAPTIHYWLLIVLLVGCMPTGKQMTEDPDLDYEVLERGTGTVVGEGDRVLFHETVKYKGGERLYSTRDLGVPVTIVIGDKSAIEGVDLGIRGMLVGEHRRLIIPPALSEREIYPPMVHPDSVLVYDIHLLELKE